MGGKVRFDDRIATVLAWQANTPADAVRVWRQLVDLVGHADDRDHAVVIKAVARFGEIDTHVPLPERRRAIAALDLRQAPPAFLDYLSQEATVYDGLLPNAPEPRAPSAFPVEDAEPASVGNSQITDLLARIGAFKARREGVVEGSAGFAFQIDEAGALHSLDGASLLAHCGEPPQGVDGQAAGAWRMGTPFTDARLVIDGGPHAGEWRISADPVVSEGGRTIGYRGIARAPRADETAVVAAYVDPAPTVNVSRLDAAIDRLRDPLEAIATVADPETLPPGEIRIAAGEVLSRSAALTVAIDALELAVAAAGDGGLDAAALLVRIDAALQPLAEARGLKISFRLASGLPPVDADPQAVERMVARLIGAVVSLGRRGERIVARLGRDRADGRMLALSITRPGRLLGWPPYALLDPPPLPTADAPELGLGFALRLVDRLAQEAGGKLTILDDRIVLSLPLPPEPRALRARWS